MKSIDLPPAENPGARESALLSTFDKAAVGIAHVSEGGHLLRVNDKLCEIVGYSRAELMARTFQQITYAPDLPNDLEHLHRLIRGDIDTYNIEKRYVRKDGSLIWAELTVSMVNAGAGSRYFISIISDIGDRKRAEDALLQAHLQLARERHLLQRERDNFFNLSRDCLAISGLDGRFVRVNAAFCELMGYTHAEMTSQPFFNFVHPDDHEKVKQLRHQLSQKPDAFFDNFESRYITKDGSVKWMSWTGRSIAGVGNYISGRDVTQKKAEEAAAKQRQVFLQTSMKLNAIGQMAANMAHEINNPLTIIYGEACMLRKMVETGDTNTNKLSRIASNVGKMSERIVSIVNGLRALAREGSSDPMKAIPIRQILDETIPFCRGKITAANIQLTVESVDHSVYVCCRSVQLSQALLNLLNNAYDAVADRDGAHIEVFTRHTDSRVEICVRDNGAGLPEEIRSKLFQPFVSTKEEGKGMGLGLSVSREMIQANGGELIFSDSEGGTTFVISLPRVDHE